MIPFASTFITIRRAAGTYKTRTAYDPPPIPTGTSIIAQHVRAVISQASMDTELAGGTRIIWNATMQSDITTLQPLDTVEEDDGTVWTAIAVKSWTHPIGPAHMIANLRRVTGAV